MDRKRILEKAIQKAKSNGWDGDLSNELNDLGGLCDCYRNHIHWFDGSIGEYGQDVYPEDVWSQVIFNHGFAKALWRVDSLVKEDREIRVYSLTQPVAWQYHLQQMVISDDPIKYLGDNI